MKKKVLIGIIVGVIAVAALLVVLLIPHEHTWSEWQVSKTATCENDGLNIRFCDKCGESQSMTIYAEGHSWSSWSTSKEVTCTDNGLETRACKKCGESESQTIYSNGHKWGAWSITKQDTCTTNGSKERVCSCGEKETQTIIGEHSWKSATCVDPKKCEKCNRIEGKALGHTTTLGYCSRCNKDIKPTVNLPSVPLTFYSYSDGVKITELSYYYDSYGNLVITYSGEIVAGEYIWFDYQFIDEDGYVIDTGTEIESGYKKGDKFKNKTFKLYESELNGVVEITVKLKNP